VQVILSVSPTNSHTLGWSLRRESTQFIGQRVWKGWELMYIWVSHKVRCVLRCAVWQVYLRLRALQLVEYLWNHQACKSWAFGVAVHTIFFSCSVTKVWKHARSKEQFEFNWYPVLSTSNKLFKLHHIWYKVRYRNVLLSIQDTGPKASPYPLYLP
jgi:hypothetical protein